MENENEFADVVAAIEDERASKLPEYGGFLESVFGEMNRMSEIKMKELAEKEVEL